MPGWLMSNVMSEDVDNFFRINLKDQKAFKLDDKVYMGSSDESIFTLNVDEDKPSSDMSSSECHTIKKKTKKIRNSAPCENHNTEVQYDTYDSFEEPTKKKKKKHKRRNVEDSPQNSMMEDSVDLNNISLYEEDMLESSPKKKLKKKKQREDDGDEAVVGDSNVACESADNVTSKKKKKKKKDKESEVRECPEDSFCDSSLLVEEVVSQKKKKKKSRGENEVTEDVLLELCTEPDPVIENVTVQSETGIEQSQVSSSKERKKKKRKLESSIELCVEKSPVQNNVESENDGDTLGDTPKKKRKSCDSVETSVETIKNKKRKTSCDDVNKVAEKNLEFLDGNCDIEKKITQHNNALRKQKIQSSEVDVDILLDESIEGEFLRKDQVEILDNLTVEVPFQVPPLHLIETQIIKALSSSEKTLIANLDLTVKTGPYTKKEDEQIQSNWEWFCQLHGIAKDETYLFSRFKHLNAKPLPATERFKFLRFLAHDLPDRLLCSVYRRFRRIYANKTRNTGRFTEAEDKIIINYMKTHTGQVFLELGRILNRHRLAVERRYNTLTTEKTPITWSDELSVELVKHLKRICGISKSELEHYDISLEEWKQVEAKMQIPIQRLKQTWLYVVYVKLFSNDKVNTKLIRQDVIKAVYESGADDWKTINWAQLAEKYQGFTPEKICKMFKDTVEYHVPKKLQGDLKKCAAYLKKKVCLDPKGCLNKSIYRPLRIN